jgi:flagellar motility protein MotE (MotC chaperone)
MEAPKEPDPAEILAERARKRAAILAKYAASNPATPSDPQARASSALPESAQASAPSTPAAGLADAARDLRVATPSVANGNVEKAASDRSEGEGNVINHVMISC